MLQWAAERESMDPTTPLDSSKLSLFHSEAVQQFVLWIKQDDEDDDDSGDEDDDEEEENTSEGDQSTDED